MSGAPFLRLRIRNAAAIDTGATAELALAQRNASIGRAATCDWCLPDARAYVSSRHCEITYANGEYRLTDRSTNGTFLNGAAERMRGPHILCDGDWFQIGQYEIAVTVEGATDERAAPPQPRREWQGWDAPPAPSPDGVPGWGPAAAPPPAPPAPGGWDPAPAAAPLSPAPGWGVSPSEPAAHWSPAPAPPPDAPPGWGVAPPPPPAPAPPPPASGWAPPSGQAGGSSPWDLAPPPVPPASPWSAADHGAPATAEDAWGKLAGSYAVDWTRGGFGAPPPPPVSVATEAFAPPSFARPAPPSPARVAHDDPQQAPPRPDGTPLRHLLAAAGVDPALVKGDEAEVMAMAGGLLRRLVAGLVVMMEARARAKSQMGAQTTIFHRDGNNPLKFARSPESALAQLLNEPLSGYMPAERAIEDSFQDLQLHQIATLKAMQGALRATLVRFAPDAIRKRAEAGGLLKRILPGAREAALWQAYEREFSGVARGSDEAFMDVFAKEFRKAYEEQQARGG